MIKKLVIALLLTFATSIACANGYSYVENPDPNKYTMKWEGPEPNCSDNTGGYEIKGWYLHNENLNPSTPVKIRIFLKNDPHNFVLCTIDIAGEYRSLHGENCTSIDTSNTHWITVKGYNIYKTWACG